MRFPHIERKGGGAREDQEHSHVFRFHHAHSLPYINSGLPQLRGGGHKPLRAGGERRQKIPAGVKARPPESVPARKVARAAGAREGWPGQNAAQSEQESACRRFLPPHGMRRRMACGGYKRTARRAPAMRYVSTYSASARSPRSPNVRPLTMRIKPRPSSPPVA